MIRKELEDLCDILSGKSTNFQNVDWEKLIKDAEWHRVIPQLTRMLGITKDSENVHNIPNDIFNGLIEFYKGNIYFANIQLFELKILSEVLRKSEIHFIVLKGLPLSNLIYNAINIRSSKDIDILIEKSDREKVIELLQNANYKVDVPETNTKIQSQIFDTYYNQIQAWHKERNICIEIHWRCTTNPNVFNSPFREIYANSEKFNIGGLEVQTLPMAETIAYLSAHFARTEVLRLKWVCDMDALIRNCKLSWDEIENAAKKYSCSFALKSTLITCSKLFDTPRSFIAESNFSLRVKVFTLLNVLVLDIHSSFPPRYWLRLLLSGDNIRTFFHDLRFILSPRVHNPEINISGSGSLYLFYFLRVIKLPLKLGRYIVKYLRTLGAGLTML